MVENLHNKFYNFAYESHLLELKPDVSWKEDTNLHLLSSLLQSGVQTDNLQWQARRPEENKKIKMKKHT